MSTAPVPDATPDPADRSPRGSARAPGSAARSRPCHKVTRTRRLAEDSAPLAEPGPDVPPAEWEGPLLW